MKAERRHELKESDLAHIIEQVRGFLNEHGKRLGMIVIAAAVVVAVVGITVRSKATTREEAWLRKNTLRFGTVEAGRKSLTTLRSMTLQATDDAFVLAGLIDLGRQALQLAQQVDDPPDSELNEMARDAFERLLERFPSHPIAFGVAHVGLTTVEGNRFALDFDPIHQERAREHLTAVVENPALNTMPFHRLAADGLESLADTFSTVRFDPALEEDTEALAAPRLLTPERVSPDELPANLQTIRIGPDGTVDLVEEP